MTVKGNLPKFYLVPVQHPVDPETRRRNIKKRLYRLEKAQRNLHKTQKWPTQQSMTTQLYRELSEVPEIVIQPPTPEPSAGWSYTSSPRSTSRPSPRTLQYLLTPPTTPREEFPFPVMKGETRTSAEEIPFIDNSFIYFQFLPAELRLQIWDLELRRPKLIEAKFSSQFSAPTFVGGCTRGSPLLYACRESREQALSLPYSFLTPVQRDFGNR
jgi:hypothetical protein